MNKLFNYLILIIFIPILAFGQEESINKYQFTTVASVNATSVKNQYKSGTCWSFATVSFLEAEVLRLTKKTVDLSEIFFVYHAYNAKAKNYVQMHGSANFGPGGQAHDVMDVIKNHGFITETDYNGLHYGTDKHVHGEIDEVLLQFLKGVVSNKNGSLSPVWPLAFASILQSYFLQPPTKTSTGESTIDLAKTLKINPDDYIELTSYNHHPFYQKMRLEIPDNWSYNGNYYNLPIDEMMLVIDNALKNGYSVCWDGDVSDAGFSHRDGVAVVPETKVENLQGTEMSKWQNLSSDDLKKNAFAFAGPVPEKVIDQNARQIAFENYSTTDDHLMHLTAIVKDSIGTIYYQTKNSWGESGYLKGYLNMSLAYVKLNTVAIMVHKDALPKEIKLKLGL